MTPEIDRACQTPQVQHYLTHLNEFVGHETEPSELLPTFPADRTFKGAHPVADTPILLSLDEDDPTTDGKRTAIVQTLYRGPNLGSAGGPTLMHLGPIARLTYAGILSPIEQAN
jgi:hypothetical protein